MNSDTKLSFNKVKNSKMVIYLSGTGWESLIDSASIGQNGILSNSALKIMPGEGATIDKPAGLYEEGCNFAD